jgi:hypothetical protein
MTLIVAVQTNNDQIIVGSDGLLMNYNNAADLNSASPTDKLCRVEHTGWILGFAGSNVVGGFHKRIEAEVKLGQRAAFDPRIEIGGPLYFNALHGLAFEGSLAAPGTKLMDTPAVLAGFDINKKPYLLQSVIPKGGSFPSPDSYVVLGAPGPSMICHWILRALQSCPQSTEEIKKLLCFAIWEVSCMDLRIGRLESKFPISICVMEADKPHQCESFDSTAVDGWLNEWHHGLQDCFMRVIQRIGPATPAVPPDPIHGPQSPLP